MDCVYTKILKQLSQPQDYNKQWIFDARENMETKVSVEERARKEFEDGSMYG